MSGRRISPSAFVMRRTPWLRLPSASKIPDRKPRFHACVASAGHCTMAAMRATEAAADVRMAVMARRTSVAGVNANRSVRMPSAVR